MKAVFVILLIFGTPAVLAWIPLKILGTQKREARSYAILGLIIGGIMGFYFGLKLTGLIMDLIYGDLSKYSIRLDLLLGSLIGASLFSSTGVIVGGWVCNSRKRKKDKT